MSSTLLRQFQLLQFIPRHPQRRDAAWLRDALEGIGYKTTLRSVQRDLNTLSTDFQIVNDDRNKPYGWYWAEGAEQVLLPAMDPHTALALRLVEAQLVRALPPATLKHLQPFFAKAKAQLAILPNSSLKTWPERVRVLSRTQPLVPPEVKQEVYDAAYEALFFEKRLEIVYRGRDDADAKSATLNPLGIVLRDGATYLICTYFDYTDVRYLPLHRFQSALVLEEKRKSPKGFSLDAYIASSAMDFQLTQKDIKLKLRVHGSVVKTLDETPLGTDQVIKEDGTVRVTVRDTLFLRGWIFSYGEHVEVLGPKSLRDEMKSRAEKLARSYA